MDINEFIHEEVHRQGFEHGGTCGKRVDYMLEAWEHAQERSQDRGIFSTPIGVGTIAMWGKIIEPQTNHTGFRMTDVRIGDRLCCIWRDVPPLMEFFSTQILPSNMPPSRKYHIFELIHPFVDGNGRVGKIIFNYLNGTLDNPIFPPQFFGEGSIV